MAQLARTPAQIGATLQQARKRQGMTQSQLAERAGLRQEMVSKVEGGHPGAKISTLCDLFAALDLEMTVTPRTRSSAADLMDIF